ncbi:hypothetical protein DFJ73DRAFT_778479 [Zopfochytrium polystomum]|nr:hypothetical protein DFJ73DRAFT_778479 [Zopfochytrium polystomum]
MVAVDPQSSSLPTYEAAGTVPPTRRPLVEDDGTGTGSSLQAALFPESKLSLQSQSVAPVQSAPAPSHSAIVIPPGATTDSQLFSYPDPTPLNTKFAYAEVSSLWIAVIAFVAIVLVGGAIAVAIIVSNKNKSSTTATVTSPSPSTSSSPTTASNDPTFVPDKFQIRLSGSSQCIAGTAYAACESNPGPSSRQIFQKTGQTWKQAIGIDPCDGNGFQQITYRSVVQYTHSEAPASLQA